MLQSVDIRIKVCYYVDKGFKLVSAGSGCKKIYTAIKSPGIFSGDFTIFLLTNCFFCAIIAFAVS